MCGRLFMRLNLQQLQQISRCAAIRNVSRYRSSYNVGPTNYIPCIRKNSVKNNKQDISDEQKVEQLAKQQINNSNKQNIVFISDPIIQEEGCEASNLFITAKHLFYKENQNEQIQMQEQVNVDNQYDQPQISNESQQTDRMLDFLYWGFQTEFQNIINIRSEEAEMKKTFKPLLNKNRCVCITQGYYEWTPDKIPYVFYNNQKDYMLICGIYSEESEQVMLLTRESFGKFDQVHHRMPVFIEEEEVEQWLNPNIEYKEVLFKQLLKRDRKVYDEISSYRCSNNVNNIREQSVKCLMSYEEHKKYLEKNGIGKFFKTNKVVEDKKDEETQAQSYYKKEINKQLTQETNDLATQFENTFLNDSKKEGEEENKLYISQSEVENVHNNINSDIQESKQKTQQQNKKSNQINSIKKERQIQEKQEQIQQSSTKKSNKLVKPSANTFLEGLEQFFQNKNNEKK
ncbi:hypothetical protein TTHERM_00196060 (macronuclear) [Tetrahymena thermophila SB210]|uniref:Uncharacterized protein n=1 Tax=Tetrahymena thermophila (strain SB210) TaxID=312017 RepID=Q23K28_TETTS|nr:hypothetical protein TTHERM_00196060 [Tetrahymena thermophila SB210]EAR97015.1 hypothetical protein TTHERM_00196060 [Tetrahymena thermophila SB210]|eukprot:XP_001017260.1 hypothetical protein TTHERM_00196060 [Tetrahymena thermophila SB210]